MKRKDSICALAGVGKSGGLLNILAEEGTQILDDLVKRLRNIMAGTELDKSTDRYSRTSLEI